MIRAENVTKIYRHGEINVSAIDNVSLHIQDGAMACIIGKSGSGKSTLLRQLGLIDTPSSGKIYIDNTDTSILTENDRIYMRLNLLGYIFQEYALMPELTALENVLLPFFATRRKTESR